MTLVTTQGKVPGMGSGGRVATGRMRRVVVALAALSMVPIVALVATEAEAADAPAHWQEAPIASWRIDGVGYATLLVGDTVYVGGDFASVRSPDGSIVVPRANLAAFDVNTGALRPAFQANTNGIVRSLVRLGDDLVVGGSYTSIGGVARGRLAAVDLVTGTVSSSRIANTNSNVYALSVGGGRLFVGGSFSAIAGTSRTRVAALDAATWAVSSYSPVLNNSVTSIVASTAGDRVYVGGAFTTVGGVANPWLLATDAAGQQIPTAWEQLQGAPLDLALDANGSHLAVAQSGAGNQGTLYDTSTGRRLWRQRCDGDAQAVHIVEGTMLTGFHEACDLDVTQRLTANDVADGARDLGFKPSFDRFWGVRDLGGDAQHLIVAGDFTTISGVAVQGFAIFGYRYVPPPPVSLSGAATWRFLVTPSAPDAAWNQPGFDDAAWPAGPAQLGFGDGDEATVIGFGPDANNKYLTTYFRTTFEAAAVPDTLTLNLLADDGAAVYVNGVEVVRDNLPAGSLTGATRASIGRSGVDESTLRSFAIAPSAVHPGTNTIAVEVHQDTPGSSDLSFAASLGSTGAIAPPTTTTTEVPTTTTTTTTVPAPSALFTDRFDGFDGSPWTGWSTSAASGSVTLSAGAGRLAINDVPNAFARAQLTSLVQRSDAEIRFSYQWSGTGRTAFFNVFARGSGGWANAYRPWNGYGIELSSNSSSVAVR